MPVFWYLSGTLPEQRNVGRYFRVSPRPQRGGEPGAYPFPEPFEQRRGIAQTQFGSSADLKAAPAIGSHVAEEGLCGRCVSGFCRIGIALYKSLLRGGNRAFGQGRKMQVGQFRRRVCFLGNAP